MAIVPRVEPQVQMRPALQQGVNVQASPSDFGADIGRGMQGLAQGMSTASQAFAAMQDIEDTARAKDADNSYAAWVRERMYGDGGYMTLEGRAAVDARSAFEREAEEKRREFGKDLTGGAARKYSDASTARYNTILENSIVHSANARKQWFKDASASRLNTFEEDAVAAYNDPKRVNTLIAAGQAEIRQQAQMLGWDADTLANREAEYISSVRYNTGLRMMADDPVAANEYYQAHKDEFTGPHQFDFEQKLEVPLLQEKVKRNVDSFTTASAPAQAADLIRSEEGFSDEPYWDVNAYRIGYGSDTITKADGTFVKVTPGMTVTRADAERDLARRINTEFVPRIISDVGQEAWDRLPGPAKAALASVAYNYGSLPNSVSTAVRSGNIDGIAAAIQSLGANTARRAREADVARGMTGSPTAGATPGFTDIESYLQTITDPDERDATRKAIYARIELQNKAEAAQRDALKERAFQLIETQNISPFDLPPDITTAIGMDGMSSLMTYWEKRSSGEKITTDAQALYDLQTLYATNPAEFAKINLLDYKNVLSAEDYKRANEWRQTALTDERKAKDESVTITTAFSQAQTQLEAIGLTTTGKDGRAREDAARRLAEFQNVLAAQLEEFKRLNNGRNANQMEIQQMINRLLLPIVVDEPGGIFGIFGGRTQREAFLFEAGGVSDASTVDVAVRYEDIPIELRRGIATDLERELGRKPSEEEIVTRYEQFVLGR